MYSGQLAICFFDIDDASIKALEAVEPISPLTCSYQSAPAFDAAQAQGKQLVLTAVDPGNAELMDALDGFLSQLAQASGEDVRKSGALGTDVIAVCAPEHASAVVERLPQVTDVWAAKGAPAELAWRLGHWMQLRKDRADAQQNLQYLDALIDSTPSLVWFKDRNGIHKKVNLAFCETVGKSRDDVQGRGHAYIWNVEADDPACIESEAQVMATRTTCVSEEVVQSGAGTKLLTTYKSPLYDLDGSVMGTVGVGVDITQERAYENGLLEKNRTLESMFKAMDAGVLTHSLDGTRVIGVNQAALAILGYESEEDMMAHGFDMVADSVLDEDKEILRKRFATLKQAGDSVSFEYRVRHNTGDVLHVMGSAKLIEQDGELYYQRFLLDYSDRKREEELRERRQQSFIRALSEDNLVVCSFDLDTGAGELLRMSDEADEELGSIFKGHLTYDGSLEDYVSRRVLPDDRATLFEVFDRPRVLEELRKRKRFTVTFHSLVDNKLGFRQVTIVRAGSWAEDAPEGHLMVMGLRNVDRETREEMERKEQLEEALQRANRANEAKSLFLSNMSHDIRTPMNAIIGFTTLAEKHLQDAKRVENYLQKIQSSSSHLLSLINDILDMSRIESGKIYLENKPCDLNELLDSLCSIVDPEVKDKDLHFTVDRTDLRDPYVECDELKVKQVLLNILGNATKFTPRGGDVTLRVEQAPASNDGFALYRVIVSDTGIGMEPEFIKHIFDPFERERTSTLSGTQGTGLGMAIAKRLVDMVGGSIEVSSVKGEGSTFTVTIPLRVMSELTVKDASDAQDRVLAIAEELRGTRILLVDDNKLNREIATTLLEDVGFVVDQAVDGQDALNKIGEAPAGCYQLVLMDIQMPVMNGYDAARAIRALDDEAVAYVPIFAVTADAFDEDRKKALAAGMNGHVAKPIEIETLLEAVEGVLLERQRA